MKLANYCESYIITKFDEKFSVENDSSFNFSNSESESSKCPVFKNDAFQL